LSDANGGSLGLAEDVVFYMGNAIGETGNYTTNAIVNASDEIGARSNPAFFPPATIANRYDFNRDRRVNATDQIIVRSNNAFFDALRLITAPEAPGGAPAAAPAPAPAMAPQVAEASEPETPEELPSEVDLLTVDVLGVQDVIGGGSETSAETVLHDYAAERQDVLQAPDSSEGDFGDLEVDLLADLDPLEM